MRACRKCGCTEDHACMDNYGNPCFWVEEDLCSECAGDEWRYHGVKIGKIKKDFAGQFDVLCDCFEADEQGIIHEK